MTAEIKTTTAAPYVTRTAIEAVKAAVSIEEYAATLTELHNHRGRCPVHQGDNPQVFAVYPDEGRWYCFRCNQGGDVVDLARAAEGAELWEAVVSLAQQFGVDLPKRPDRWHDQQDQKAKVRNAAKRHIAQVYQRRLTRLYAPLVLAGGEPPAEELEVLEDLAAALWPVAWSMAARRVGHE